MMSLMYNTMTTTGKEPLVEKIACIPYHPWIPWICNHEGQGKNDNDDNDVHDDDASRRRRCRRGRAAATEAAAATGAAQRNVSATARPLTAACPTSGSESHAGTTGGGEPAMPSFSPMNCTVTRNVAPLTNVGADIRAKSARTSDE